MDVVKPKYSLGLYALGIHLLTQSELDEHRTLIVTAYSLPRRKKQKS